MIYTIEAWSHNPDSFNSDLLSNADIHALIHSDELEEQLPFEIVMVRWKRSDSQVRHGTRVTREYTFISSLLKTTFLRIKMKHPGVLHYDWTTGRLAHIAGEGTLSYAVNG